MNSAIKKCEEGMIQVEKWMKMFNINSKPYQQTAIRWALLKEQGFYNNCGECQSTGKPGLIADEMGLGKTIMMLGTWVGNFQRNTLIVVPSALLNQWEELIFKWLGIRALVFHGKKSKMSEEDIKQYHIVLTTYGMISTRKSKGLIKYNTSLWDISWDRIIYDEAHHLRNPKSNKHLGANKLQGDKKWFMTGTPVQNSEKDLVSLCKLMGIWTEIRENPKTAKDILKPYVMMRSKVDVGIELEAYKEEVIKITKYDSEEEVDFLKEIHSKLNFTNVTTDNVNEVMRFLSGDSPLPLLIRARQACVLPSIITSHFEHMRNTGLIPSSVEKIKPVTNTKIRMITEKINQESKLGNSSLVFCHYTQEMETMNDILKNTYNLDVEMLNGNTSGKNRKIIPTLTPDVLMVQIQSCCEGLNLQQFSSVFFTSPHWNPAVEDQAIARAHRLGQKKNVKVYKYVVSGLGSNDSTVSLDQYCINVQEKKRESMVIFQNDNRRECPE